MKHLFYCLIVFSLNLCANGRKRPNIVFIIADDLGWGDVGLHGTQQIRTPNIDVLASNGIILNNYYVSPICSPSRSALLTGYHPIHTGMQHDVLGASLPYGLPLKYTILPQYIKSMGYETHAVGKWHQGFHRKEYIPTERGFDSHFGYWTGQEDYYNRVSAATIPFWGFDFRCNEESVLLEEYQDLYSTQIYTNKSIDIILNNANNSSKPLFLYLAHQAVHSGGADQPLQAPQEYIEQFSHIKDIRRRTFAAMASALDDSIGDIFSALKKANILNETIIIFTTDNGGAICGTQGQCVNNSIGSNWPLRGSKYTLFEGGIRGFAFIWSSLLENQYISDHLMHIQDWLPTIYTAIGGNSKALGSIDGIDMWNVLNKKLSNPRKQLLHNIDDILNVWALRDGDYKLIFGTYLNGQYNSWFLPPGEGENNQTYTTNERNIDYKNSKVYKVLKQMQFSLKPVKQIQLNCNSSLQTDCNSIRIPCLFDLKSDPCEYNNIFNQKQDIVESMLNLLSNYNTTAVIPGNKPMDPNANPNLHHYHWSIYQ